jgi:hypothetical protein
MRSKLWPLFVTMLISIKLLAQGNACEEILLPTLEQVSDICQSIERNEICYGNNEVEASFSGDSPISFANPADRAPVPMLNSLHTSAYDSATGRFGVAVMKVQTSNIPNTLPGQILTFLLMGEVGIENAVLPEDAFVPVEPIEVFTLTAANIRNEPNSSSGVAWSVAANTSLAVDARNEAGDWFRVVGTAQTAWVSTSVLVQNEAMSSLPVYNRASRTVMQAFYFTAGIGRPSCEQASNQLIIQGPQGVETVLTINGAELRIGSTIALSKPSENVLRISVLDGSAVVNQISVPSGFSIDAPLRENHIQASSWGNFRPLPPQELDFHQQTSSSLGEELVSYVPDVPTVEEVRVIEAAIAPPTATPTEMPTATPLPNSVNNGGNNSGGSGGACYSNINHQASSFNYVGPANTWGNRRVYLNGTCAGNGSIDNSHAVIFASDSNAALTICGNLGGGYIAHYPDWGWNTPTGWYECGY